MLKGYALSGRSECLSQAVGSWYRAQAVVFEQLKQLSREPSVSRKGKKRHRARAIERKPTPKQVESYSMAMECKGNIAEAARRLGKDRSTVAQSYKAALGKGGKAFVKQRTRGLPHDGRSQVTVTAD